MEPYSADSAKRKERKFFRGNSLVPNVKVVAIYSSLGFPIASILPQGVDETSIAAMTVAFHSLAKRTVIEMRKGVFEALYIKGADGYIITVSVIDHDFDLIVVFSTTRDVNLSFISPDNLRRIVVEVVLSVFKV